MSDALLLTMMDPPVGADSEFNDWVDLEHIPERRTIPGFRSALRFTNRESSPRYMAIYDLTGSEILDSPAYRAVSGDNLSAWSKRMLAGASARWRFEGQRFDPLHAGGVTKTATSSELLVVRWRGAAERRDEEIWAKLESALRDVTGLSQLRAFVSKPGVTGHDYVGIAECRQPIDPNLLDPDRFSLAQLHCDFAQVFVPLSVRSAKAAQLA